MTNESTYPKRAAYFAHRYCRLLTKTCAAQEVGPVAFVLCVTVAHLEDAKRYSGPVTFYNEQLMPLAGVTKWRSLNRARERAAAAGWLHYEPGNKGQRMPGRYWVTIPERFVAIDDTPCDEANMPQRVNVGANGLGANGPQRAIEGVNVGAIEGANIPSLTLAPNIKPADADVPAELLALIDGWNKLGNQIVMPGNGARRDQPAKAVLAGWNRASKNPEQRKAFEDVPALLVAIRTARFCHRQGWFTLPWLFGSNKNRECNVIRLLAGAYNGNGSSDGQSKKPEPIKYRA